MIRKYHISKEWLIKGKTVEYKLINDIIKPNSINIDFRGGKCAH